MRYRKVKWSRWSQQVVCKLIWIRSLDRWRICVKGVPSQILDTCFTSLLFLHFFHWRLCLPIDVLFLACTCSMKEGKGWSFCRHKFVTTDKESTHCNVWQTHRTHMNLWTWILDLATQIPLDILTTPSWSSTNVMNTPLWVIEPLLTMQYPLLGPRSMCSVWLETCSYPTGRYPATWDWQNSKADGIGVNEAASY